MQQMSEDELINLSKCPKCGSDFGYRITIVQKLDVVYDFCGCNIDVTDAILIEEKKRIRCAQCNAIIGTAKDRGGR